MLPYLCLYSLLALLTVYFRLLWFVTCLISCNQTASTLTQHLLPFLEQTPHCYFSAIFVADVDNGMMSVCRQVRVLLLPIAQYTTNPTQTRGVAVHLRNQGTLVTSFYGGKKHENTHRNLSNNFCSTCLSTHS